MGAVSNYIESLFSLEGKVAIVTGAAGHLGKVFTECLLAAGAKVILFGRGDKISDMYVAMATEYGNDKVAYCKVDFYTDHFRSYLSDTVGRNNGVDILVNNAYDFSKDTGFNDPSGKLENISKDQWMCSMESGVYWPALAIQVIGEGMKGQGSGSIINISSMYGIVSPNPNLYEGIDTVNPPSYGAGKAALLALTRYTAAFYGMYGIRCNAIAPGAFPDVGGTSYNAPKDDSILNRLADRTVLGRYGVPEDLAGALIFLASDASSYMTGQVVVVDGGWTIT